MRIGIAAPIDASRFNDHVEADPPLVAGYSYGLTTEIALAYIREGHHVSIFASDETASSTREVQGDSCTVYVTPRRSNYRERAGDWFAVERRALKSAMLESRVDIIHAHWSYEFALAALASHSRVLMTVHDWAPAILRGSPDPYRAVRLAMQIRAITRARHVSAPSEHMGARIRRYYRKPVSVIPNGLTGEWWTEADTDGRPDREPSGFVFGALNNGFDRHKNVKNLIAAFALVRAGYPTASCRIAGLGYELGGPAQRWAVDRGLDDGIEWVGPVGPADVRSFYRSLDLFVHPSREESFGMVVLEALASGVEVLGGETSGAVPWIIGSSRTTDVTSPARLARSMIARLNEGPGKRVSRWDIESLRARFSIEEVAQSYLSVLQKAAS